MDNPRWHTSNEEMAVRLLEHQKCANTLASLKSLNHLNSRQDLWLVIVGEILEGIADNVSNAAFLDGLKISR